MFYTHAHTHAHAHTHTHTRLTALFPGLPKWASTRTVKPIWILLKQETVSGSMQVCTSLQTDNHASNAPLSFLQAGCPSCRPTNNMKALKGYPCFILYNISIWDQTHDIHISGLSTYAISTSIGLNLHHTPLQLPPYHHHYQLYSVSAYEAWLC